MPWNEQDFIDIGNRVAQLERQRQEMLSGLKSASRGDQLLPGLFRQRLR